MLTLRVSLADSNVEESKDFFSRIVDHLSFFDNHILSRRINPTDNAFDIWVGESPDPSGDVRDHDDRIGVIRTFKDCDGVLVTGRADFGQSRIMVARTAGGTSPIDISSDGPRLCASWKFEEVVALLNRPLPNREICRLFIDKGIAQTREQVIEGVFALWPGECVLFDGGSLNFSMCDRVDITLPAAFNDHARATEAFIDTVANVMKPLVSSAKRPLLEFSGGMDSTCVAIAAASLGIRLESYGVIQPGAVGRQQRARREELIRLLKITDHTGSASSTLPFDALILDECQLTPNDDLFRMCLADTLDADSLRDVDSVITGLGGDDLCMENTFLREAWEVPGYTSASAVVASMGRADMLMRRGIWPLNPLAHPSVVNLCRAMPAAIRKGRLLNQFAMARAGLSDGYIVPRYQETFANVLRLDAIERDFNDYFVTSLLNDFAIIDVSGLLLKPSSKTELGLPLRLISKLWSAAKLEVVLRRYLR